MKTHTRRSGHFLSWWHRNKQAPWGRDPLAYQPELIRGTLSRIGRLFGQGCYFDLDVTGWGRIPSSPSMLVSNHSGGTTILDVWGFLVAWYRHFGVHRPIHPMAHEMILGNRITGPYFGQRGVLHACRELGHAVLSVHRRDLMVMPGGDLDTWRPFAKRYEVCFAGRTGYAALALKTGVPVVPMANTGAHETLIVLTTGRRLARALRLRELFRAEIFPVHLSLPWGLAVGPWPHLPTPTRLRYRIGDPVPPPDGARPGEEPPASAVREYDRRVRAAVQRLLDELRQGR